MLVAELADRAEAALAVVERTTRAIARSVVREVAVMARARELLVKEFASVMTTPSSTRLTGIRDLCGELSLGSDLQGLARSSMAPSRFTSYGGPERLCYSDAKSAE